MAVRSCSDTSRASADVIVLANAVDIFAPDFRLSVPFV